MDRDEAVAHIAEQKKVGGPAFPSRHFIESDGMTLRDYFAAKATQATITNPTGANGFTFSERSAWCYQQADAMLAERAK